MPGDEAKLPEPQVARVTVHDGVEIAVALYMPEGDGPFPAVLAASPYRFDNNALPAGPQFLWRETGPIGLYLTRGYVYAFMDVRGSGRSGGEFRFLDSNEQRDLYDVIEWLGHQPWSNGKVGGLGQSYFCMSQWWMAIVKPPSLACIAAFDGLNDPYRAGAYHGGILCDFWNYWWNQNRIINRHPANGQHPREQEYDLALLVQQHPTYDDFWRERCAAERLEEIEVPLYSIGIWGKVELHTRGNIEGYRRASGPKKLRMNGPPNAFAANREFNGVELHETLLLPFYDHYLKGEETDYAARPNVEYFVRGAETFRTAESWPPPGVAYTSWYLSAEKSGSVSSLNDGSLTREPPADASATSYAYPNPGWMMGVVGMGPQGTPDPARRVLTFTTPPLEHDLEIAGPIKLVLYGASTRSDMDFFVKISDQQPQADGDRANDINPAYSIVTKGWLRASHRALDPDRSTDMEPYHTHADPEPLEPGKVYRFDISIEPQAHRFKKGDRIRLEIVNGDSALTDMLWTHYYLPEKIGTDTIHHGPECLSELILPVTEGA
jgi:putative CocE/NonD family hydrolase